MRLVAVSIVKNEADIIEAFVRHSLAWVDLHLVFDHDSTDGTRDILQSLRAEGLPLELFTDDAIGKLQQYRSNHLSRLAARERGADWVIPLDADEILTGPSRAELEVELGRSPAGSVRSLPLLNYVPTPGDDPTEANPVRRLQHCSSGVRHTRKVMVPHALAVDEAVVAGMGSHVVHRGDVTLPDLPLPDSFYLAHFPLRSPEHQALRVVQAELQKLSRGQAHAGVDVHYRLGFQLLSENPDLFFAVTRGAVGGLLRTPASYQGGPLCYSSGTAGWNRVIRALLPYLEKLAASHGRLVDAQSGATEAAASPVIRELPVAAAADGVPTVAAFSGFKALEGWSPAEGPIAAAFLPVFHWGHAPHTRLSVEAGADGDARFAADVLTYSENQAITLELNGSEISRLVLPRINQKERWTATLPLRAGRNELVLRYEQGLVTAHDPRKLAAIFLSLRVLPSTGNLS